jgi:tRNA (cmo5U34)-methyltransferase
MCYLICFRWLIFVYELSKRFSVESQQEEDFYYSENKRIRKEQNIPDGEFYHYDTPCTIDNQIKLLSKAGFKTVKMNWRMKNTTIVIAKK